MRKDEDDGEPPHAAPLTHTQALLSFALDFELCPQLLAKDEGQRAIVDAHARGLKRVSRNDAMDRALWDLIVQVCLSFDQF